MESNITKRTEEELISDILKLKKEKNAILLVHNYQRPEIYCVADHIGDSYELSKRAAATDAEIIVFCGVRFMAETAKILNPAKKVLLPKQEAGCSLADTVRPKDILQLRELYPDAAIVCYVNTMAAVKALCDICCTSANAVKVVNSLPHQRVVFIPDKNLGKFIQTQTNKELILWEGFCHVHDTLNKDSLLAFKRQYPQAKIIAHPECRKELLEVADYVTGTGGMARFAAGDTATEYIIITECGMINKLQLDIPDKHFHGFCSFCEFMKMTDLVAVYEALEKEQYEIMLTEEIISKAQKTLNAMLAVS